ncbi:NAD(P)H-binding protein [Halomicroarcula sp. F28]|uniref:SDR family oxidoreductase n=1 Tax=Haloarcula salinisoli TaxID=2487746 RepID=UPI001C72C318|nr:NAD(P)H-binding protein [Halomicroarcula salinisoli]MBX0286805.1 NAD(P)H-binding protein [Halomicroarcula salinisoli]
MQTLVTGATGTLGTALIPRLQAAGHEVRAASRSPPADGTADWVELDLASGDGLAAAVRDVDVVVHAATAPTGDSETVDVEGTRRLLDAAADAGVSNFVYPSIAGIDDIPYSYYEHKLAAERAIEDSDVPDTILRATQFHEFVADIFDTLSKLPVWPLPTEMRIQPVAVAEVADVLVEEAVPEPRGRMPPMGGPQVHTVGDLARGYRTAKGLRRPIVRLPIPTATFRAFRDGKATCPDRAVGTVTWQAWLENGRSPSERSDGAVGAPAETT